MKHLAPFWTIFCYWNVCKRASLPSFFQHCQTKIHEVLFLRSIWLSKSYCKPGPSTQAHVFTVWKVSNLYRCLHSDLKNYPEHSLQRQVSQICCILPINWDCLFRTWIPRTDISKITEWLSTVIPQLNIDFRQGWQYLCRSPGVQQRSSFVCDTPLEQKIWEEMHWRG